MDYSIYEHKHRFAAWAASRAASVNGCRFSVEEGKVILEDAGLKQLLVSADELPQPSSIDAAHNGWRINVIAAAKRQRLNFTHGVAAKLINIYLKAAFVCGGQHNNKRVKSLHPPIDSQLLDELYEQNVGDLKREWDQARKLRWSKFNSEQYENVIANVRLALGANVPLWRIEKHWRGYQ